MVYFSKDDIIFLHEEMISEFGGSDGIRDDGMLESAIYSSLQTFDSSDLYPNITDKIARLSFGLVMNHLFIDGNKRIASKILDIGLDANGIFLKLTNEEMIEGFLGLASGKIDYPSFLSWIKSRI